MTPRSETGATAPGAEVGHVLVRDHTILATVVGSRACGLSTGSSDTDVRGIYLAPTPSFWHLSKPPPHVEGPAPEWFSWELERFCELALKANPNALEVLWSPLTLQTTSAGEELVAQRGAFVSRLAHATYAGYVQSQLTKIEADVRREGVPRWKHVMHLLRLLLSGAHLLRTGSPLIDVGPHRERLMAARRGEESWESLDAWRSTLQADLEDAAQRTAVPDRPDVERIDRWLHDVRRRSATGQAT